MNLKETANELIQSFTDGLFPEPYEFTDRQIKSLARVRGVDADGTFAVAPMEQALIREYKLNIRYGENTWPAFAEVLREEKDLHFSKFSHHRESNMNWLKEAIANCLVVGISPEEIVEQAKIECGVPC